MGRIQTAVDQALRGALILIGVGVAGYIAVLVLLSFALQEPYPFLDVSNKSGRPLLIERADADISPGLKGLSVLAWRPKEGWYAGSHGCEQEQLVARDLQGTVVARRTGACRSDTWTITAEGLSAAPRYQREPVPTDHVEVRLVLDSYGTERPVVAWWRALPQTLERAKAGGPATGVAVHGPFLEDQDLTMYLRGPDATTVLDFARTHVLRPSPGRVYAYVSAPGQPAPRTGMAEILEPTAAPSAPTR
jgi:hypothetical protein